jgi:hypothetical protein
LTDEAKSQWLLRLLQDESARERIGALRALRSVPNTRAEIVARVEELLEDRTVDIIDFPIHYGEVRLLAAETVAAIRAAAGDPRVIEMRAPRALSADGMSPLKQGLDLPRQGTIETYLALREQGRIPTFDYRFDPGDYDGSSS